MTLAERPKAIETIAVQNAARSGSVIVKFSFFSCIGMLVILLLPASPFSATATKIAVGTIAGALPILVVLMLLYKLTSHYQSSEIPAGMIFFNVLAVIATIFTAILLFYDLALWLGVIFTLSAVVAGIAFFISKDSMTTVEKRRRALEEREAAREENEA